MSGIEEIALEREEAKALAVATAEVMKHYDVLPGMSEKGAAWMALGMVAGPIYVTRIMAFRMRMQMEAKENGGQNVVSL